ncbi:MAG: hypothetical protein DCC75_12795 [Proteobacteria bacterium]|nr:MAG: hypothetical protein DCC75_12795 [Pseudomonadota bacterium]
MSIKNLRALSRSQSGLTLVEIMVVLIILGIVMAWLGSKMIGAGDKAKAEITKTKIKEIGTMIEQFQLRYNTIPGSLDELVRCSERTGPDCVPITNEESLKDAWGNRFQYSLESSGRTYKVKSHGADGKDGGEGVDYDFFGTGP